MSIKLFESYQIKNKTFKNRIVMSPMCMYSCEQEDGMVNDWHYTHYTSRAVGQVGLIMVEATAVVPEGRISPQDLGIWSDEHITGLKKLTSRVKRHGTAAGIQLAHAGRKAVLEGDILAPSALPFDDKMKTPKEMTIEEIRKTIEAFAIAAERAKKADFDVIELHAAHGYLINEFLSPLTNHRTDDYGGTQEKRYRLLRETIDAVRQVWDGPLFVRISANEYHNEGLHTKDFIQIGQWLKEQGVDLIDVSSGGVVPASIHVYPGYQVPFAEQIRHAVKIPTGTVGLITNGIQAEEILQNQRADLIFVGRALLQNPYWAKEAAKELNYAIKAPEQYRRGWD
ncbi:NADPH dehydrogenase NamA [Lederbergia galactosidilytica]|uniref:NADPH dehydrogenase n=1 Tax=Lederbergia galactosidilytica TaxID=217031 RepID=A0A178A5S0_9BACI|nr:NADPH dehydrogenase NamA [Lederbergia galactosidilytica]KRG08703.1 NADPH dehydrogenase [Virgibacillus soli]OAK75293.1 NADPH dehydrogenase [Lederbergia galactosidilytica]